ncbi:regulator of RNase E activity RraA [Pseudoduganella flava]|uniref:Putative 4-hydroxy-4-methyl-2-oxoglutarate aldolase n=1 Tax=Pseudoduganella flava TaxID=871742 RepID=A0A562Q103_9BURK|nr:RraA family protein [Pseudoduganella flava]QGZ38146.1 RraA family protein [Pseudoduganella flava]TWI50334.1 regulator of RNase E activity RraA [Pseudoduganella flava]
MPSCSPHDLQPRVQGVDAALLALYAGIDASTIGHVTEDGYVRGVQPLFRPIRLLGNAVTVRLPAVDGSVLRPALIASRPGDVLVIEMAPGDEHRACWGELRTLAARIKGLAGVVIAGCVTDVRAVTALGFPVFAEGISAVTTRPLDMGGAVNVPVRIGDVTVRPGDLVVGDDDGLFILDPARAAGIGARAAQRAQAEAERRRRLAAQLPTQLSAQLSTQLPVTTSA